MDKTLTLNKQATTTDTCPQCGRPMSDFRCRNVPMGNWCLQYGLREDPRRIITPTRPVDPYAGQIEQDRHVRRAAQEYQAAAEEAERMMTAFHNAARDEQHAIAARVTAKRDLSVDGTLVEWVPPGTPSRGDIQRLTEAREQADIWRQHAGDVAIKARTALEVARRNARRRLAAASTR
jgi:hypothetical protein